MLVTSNTDLIIIENNDFTVIKEKVTKKKILVFCDINLKKNKIFNKLIKFLKKNYSAKIDFNLKPEPTCADIDKVKKKYVSNKFELIFAIGGGSIIDAVKAISIALTNPKDIWNYVDLRYRPADKLSNKPLEIIAIPSTSGTGAEISKNSVLINTDTVEKATIKFDECYPKYAILIPALTSTLNRFVTSFTAFDAFAHCLESYLNVNANHFSKIYSLEGMKLVFENLLKCLKSPKDLKLRKNLMLGSVFGGYSLKYAGTTTCHAIAQPLTARTGIPHGLAVSIMTLPVLKYSIKKNNKLLDELFDYLFIKKNKKIKNKSNFVYAKLKNLLDKSLRNYKITDYYKKNDDIVDKLTSDTVGYMGRGLKFHPVKLSKNEIKNIISEAL